MNHTGITTGCATCHNGSTAIGKTGSHILTTAACETCHKSTTSFAGAKMSHTGITTGCATCHNGSTATGKGGGHFITTRACESCHRTTGWTPATSYTHTTPYYKPHNAGVTCATCHKTNNEVIAWQYGGYKPDCAGCHAGKFKPDSHKKVDSPKILYTVTDLKNCAGSCHEYTSSSFTTIKQRRDSKHRSTDGGF